MSKRNRPARRLKVDNFPAVDILGQQVQTMASTLARELAGIEDPKGLLEIDATARRIAAERCGLGGAAATAEGLAGMNLTATQAQSFYDAQRETMAALFEERFPDPVDRGAAKRELTHIQNRRENARRNHLRLDNLLTQPHYHSLTQPKQS